jgi:hypothetical protein
MIDAMANHNTPPKLVDNGIGRLPLYPADYDWKEETRSGIAFSKVYKEKTAAMWEELVRRIDDKHYCVTIKDKNEYYALGNKTVGWFCELWAHDWLCGVCNQHLPRDPRKDGYPLSLNVIGNLMEWRKKRADKQLYELQIEVCEETIRQMEGVAGVPQRKKDQARKSIEAEIATLKRTKRPIFTKYTIIPLRSYGTEEAEKIRKELGDKK